MSYPGGRRACGGSSAGAGMPATGPCGPSKTTSPGTGRPAGDGEAVAGLPAQTVEPARRDADLLGEPVLQLARAHPGAARSRPPGRGMEPVPLLRGVLPVAAGESTRSLAARAMAWSARTWPDDSSSDGRGSPEDLDGVGIRPARNTGSRPVVLKAVQYWTIWSLKLGRQCIKNHCRPTVSPRRSTIWALTHAPRGA